MTTRREVVHWTAASLGVIGSGLARASMPPASKALNILFLGGTGFLGPVQVEYALARGHRVALFNRGRSAAGLRYRPLAETADATLEWWRAQSADRRAKVEGWPKPEKEREAIERLKVQRG